MKTFTSVVVLSLMLLTLGCKEDVKSSKKINAAEEKLSKEEGMVPDSWVVNRVSKAKSKLESTDAGKVIWQAMEAHGGLSTWYGNGFLSFRFNYQPNDDKPVRDSYQVVDTWSNKARHRSVVDSTDQFGWNGNTAWVQAKDPSVFKYDTKFWALTPIYFLGQPFVFDGEGVNFELLPQKTFDNNENDVVKVTFDKGTGDAPDDYYILYFNKNTHLLKVIRYIVSYPAYFKDGGHAPEKFMVVSDYKTIEGIKLPTKYKTHWMLQNEEPGEYITNIEVSDIAFVKTVNENYFNPPVGATIID